MNLLQLFSTADNITATVVATYAITKGGNLLYARTIGSRRIAARNIRSLTVGNPRQYVEAMFGTPVYIGLPLSAAEPAPQPTVEMRLYNAKHGWLTVHYYQDHVVGFAFMLTDRRFRFDIAPTSRGTMSGNLGRLRYDEFHSELPLGGAELFIGPYNWGYAERHAFGRGGNYLSYALSTTMYGWSKTSEYNNAPDDNEPLPLGVTTLSTSTGDAERRDIERYRATRCPDTVAVFGYPAGITEPWGGSYDQDSLRDLEGAGPIGWKSRSQFSRYSQLARLRLLLRLRRG